MEGLRFYVKAMAGYEHGYCHCNCPAWQEPESTRWVSVGVRIRMFCVSVSGAMLHP